MKDKKLNIPIWESKDYEKFKFYKGNREMLQGHIATLQESFEQKYISPSIIFINEKFEIIDGQHRFCACKNKGLPIQYIILKGAGFKEITLLNTSQKNWKKEDFLNFYCEMEKDSYLFLKKVIVEYKVSLNVCGYFIDEQWGRAGFGDNRRSAFRQGCFEMNLQKKNSLIDMISKYVLIRDYWKFSKNASFCRALRKILLNRVLDWNRLYNKCDKHYKTFTEKANVEDYCKEFTKIYNHKQRGNRIRLHDEVGYDN
jgi:hypothetical protein